MKTTVEFWPSTVNERVSYGSTDVTLLTSRHEGPLVVHSLQLNVANSDTVGSATV